MKNPYRFLWLLSVLAIFVVQTVSGQEKKSENKVNRFLNKVENSLKKLESGNTNPAPNQTSEKKLGKSEPPALLNAKSGSLASDVVHLNVDELGQFNNGAAVVRKGKLTGLINSRGKFIIPLGEIDIADECLFKRISYDNSHQSGMFHGVKNGKPVVFNHQGKILVTGERGTFKFNKDGRFITFDNFNIKSVRGGFIDINGKLYFFDRNYNTTTLDLHNGIFIDYSDRENPTYRNINNEIITKEKFDFYRNFKEGMAIVGKKDRYGKLSYGFINTDGKVQIPIQYSKMPNDFMNGHAMVFGADGSEINYAFIDKNGKVIIQVKHNDPMHYGQLRPMANGYFSAFKYLYDDKGNYYTREEFLKKIGLNLSGRFHILEEDVLKYKANDGRFRIIIHDRIGFIDIKNNIFVDPVFFNTVFSGLIFDEASGLAYAEQKLGLNPATNKSETRKGYINNIGEFKIIINEEKANW